MTDANNHDARGRRQLLAIMGIALVTLGGSYFLFYLAKQSGGWGTTNHGAFVEPPTTIAQIGWQDLNDVALTDTQYWWVWVVSEGCDSRCAEVLSQVRATQVLLAKEASRVRRGFTDLNAGMHTQIEAQYPKLVRIRTTQRQQPGIYIVDPLGNLVFVYDLTVDQKDVLADLKKLLKVSQIG